MVPQESKVGKKLSDLTTRRTIILVLAMLFSVPLFSIGTYFQEPDPYSIGLALMRNYSMNSQEFNVTVESFWQEMREIRTPIIQLYYSAQVRGAEEGQTLYIETSENPEDLRSSETEIVKVEGFNPETQEDFQGIATYDLRPNTKLQAGLGIGTTLFVCIVLSVGALLFSNEANTLVIVPIEQMIEKVNRITANPLEAAQEEEAEALIIDKIQEEQAILELKQGKEKKPRKKKKEGEFETVVLQQTIVKIGALLALGFGEAGSKIIAENMAKSGDVDPMIPGQKINAIFGFCDIRRFTDTTEVLREGVMLFTNQVGEIVHGITNQFSGAANKNIGDAFLLVWKFFDIENREMSYQEHQIVVRNSISQIADMSVLSFLKIIGETKRSRKMVKYAQHKGLNERMPGYEVKMGFGLHVGWSIEGAIGSEYKIDASYLSPNVNMAARLEGATKQYGVPLLITGNLFDIFTVQTQNYMRQIDCVQMKGSDEIYKLYTCDIDSSCLELEKK